MQHAPQLNAAQTEFPSGGAKINEIKPQNMSMPPPHYAQDPYYDAPWLEAYQPGRMGFSQQQCQYHNDPRSYLKWPEGAAAYDATAISGHPPNAVVPSAPPCQ